MNDEQVESRQMIDDKVTRRQYDDLQVQIHPSLESLGRAAAERVGEVLHRAIEQRGRARAILATGNSQLAFFRGLRELDGLDWSKVEVFHMDEYLGIDEDHPASFRRFMREKVIAPLGVGIFHGISGDPERAQQTIDEYAVLLGDAPIDVCCMGVGENGHLAFNDPPYANFDDPLPLKVVELDEVSRRQQVGEGHFPDLASVPKQAITLTIPTLLNAKLVSVIAPEERKAAAIERALEGPVDVNCPASILRTVDHAVLYLDWESAGGLESS